MKSSAMKTSCWSRVAVIGAMLAVAIAGGAPGGPPLLAAQAGTVEVVPGDSLLSIRLSDGSVLVARIASVTGDRVLLVTEAGARVEVDRASILSIRAVGAATADPNTSRLFFGPTGRTVAAGEGYVGLFELFFPFVSFGATDWLTLSGGTPIVPEAMGEIFYLAPKVRIVDMPRFQASGGVLAFFETDDVGGGSIGILYGVGSAGDPDRSLTIGAGLPFISTGDHSDFADPIFMIGGETRTGRITKLITENYVFLEESGVVTSAGFRIFGERFSGDVGIGAFLGSEAFCCLPVINVVYTFGGGR